MRLIRKVIGHVDNEIWFLNREPGHEVDGTDKNVMDAGGGNGRCVAECRSGEDIPWADFDAWTPSILRVQWLMYTAPIQPQVISCITFWVLDFPGGSVVKNASANAEDMGLIPGRGGSYRAAKPMHHNHCTWAPGLQSHNYRDPCATTPEAHMPQSPCSARREATTMRSPNTTTRELAPRLIAARGKACAATKTQHSQKQ